MEYLLLALAGVFAGYINAMAGAGSLLTLPALIFTGLDANAANATNRISVFLQTLTTSIAFARNGVSLRKSHLWIFIPACIGAVLGAFAATRFSKEVFQICIAVVMLGMLPLNFMKKRTPSEYSVDLPFSWSGTVVFFAIGFYSGFIQAASGLLILFYLGYAGGMNLIQANAIKVAFIMAMTLWALITFFVLGAEIVLGRGIILALSSVVGGILGVRASIKRGEALIRIVLSFTVLASAVSLIWRSL